MPAIADKPEWTGKGKPSDEQKAAHQAAMQAKEDIDDSEDRIKEKKEKEENSRELKALKIKASRNQISLKNSLIKVPIKERVERRK
ncbi:hypothetical protein NYF23_03085 [SAR92 clade bacterium H455]|uniref:Uncharacterized protein n=1 Tax=SAR92 clade bacterium H455 TaxID=2974818 RepID=A0ABY5TP46_9GAMM|nr:hypothetical protein NYF23_03085 [SAR92 clade bacterium H455]